MTVCGMKSALTAFYALPSTSTPMADDWMQHSDGESDISTQCASVEARWCSLTIFMLAALWLLLPTSHTICVRIFCFFRAIGLIPSQRPNHSRRSTNCRGVHCELHLQEVHLNFVSSVKPPKGSSLEESTNSRLHLKNLSFLAFRRDLLPYQPTRR